MSTKCGSAINYINEEFQADAVSAIQLDDLLASGWRHFGTHFFRYNLGMHENEIRRVTPLRVRLADFKLSTSQRRVLRKNADLKTEIAPIKINEEIHELFNRHKRRFKSGVPDSIYDFLSANPATVPTDGFQISARLSGTLFAVSFFDVGSTGISAIYASFDPNETTRSLGIFTMLKVIEFAIHQGKEFYYPGYAYEGESFYDYKKRFAALERYDWKGDWVG